MTTTHAAPTSATSRQPLSAKDVLFGPAVDGTPAGDRLQGEGAPSLEQALADSPVDLAVRGALDGLRAGVLDAVRAEVLRRAEEMVSAPVVDRLTTAWRSYKELVDAAGRTVDDPGTTELVDLASTETTSTNTWTVDVIVGAPRVSVDFTLAVVFEVHAAVATVRDGRLIEIGDGRCNLHVTFSAIGQVVAERRAEVDLYDHLSFTPGLLIARNEGPVSPGL
jgi:hypothetical protein